MPQVAVTIRKLARGDDRSQFSCGNDDLDRFFRHHAGQNQFKHFIGVTYVAVADQTGAMLGYATVAAGSLTVGELPEALRKRLPDYPLPILRLARLAVDTRAQGLGIAKRLLKAVLDLALRQADASGCVGVVVDAKPDRTSFYEQLGFRPLEAETGELGGVRPPLPMFLPLGSIPRGG